MGHTRITHGHLMERKPAPICVNCNVLVTVQHILVDCQQYTRQRNRWFNHLDTNSLTLKKILEESEKFCIGRVMGY